VALAIRGPVACSAAKSVLVSGTLVP